MIRLCAVLSRLSEIPTFPFSTFRLGGPGRRAAVARCSAPCARLRPCVDAPGPARVGVVARVSSRSICMAIPIFVRRVAVSAGFRRVSTTAVLGDHAVWPVAVGLVASRPRTCGSWETCGSWVLWESATGPARHAVENERARLARKNEPEFLRTGIPQTLVSVADCALTVRPADAPAEGAMPPQPGRGWGVQRRVAWDPGTATGRAVGRRPRSRRWPRCARPPCTNMPSTRVSPRPLRAAGAWGGGSRSRIGWRWVAVGRCGHRATGLRAALRRRLRRNGDWDPFGPLMSSPSSASRVSFLSVSNVVCRSLPRPRHRPVRALRCLVRTSAACHEIAPAAAAGVTRVSLVCATRDVVLSTQS